MSRKLLTFSNDLGNKQRVYFRDGECLTPSALETVLNGQYNWDSIKTSGLTFVEARNNRHRKSPKLDADNPEFLGLQVAERVAAQAPTLDSEGNAVVKHRGKKSSITTELLADLKRLAEAGKTLAETEKETGLPVATIRYTAKKEGIEFKKGKRGFQGREAKPADPALLAEMAKLALFMTIKEAADSLKMAKPALYTLAKKNGIKFVAGKKGRQATGEVKVIDPALVENVKRCQSEGKTVSQTTKELNVEWFVIVKIAKQENLEFVKGKRGRAKKEVEPLAA